MQIPTNQSLSILGKSCFWFSIYPYPLPINLLLHFWHFYFFVFLEKCVGRGLHGLYEATPLLGTHNITKCSCNLNWLLLYLWCEYFYQLEHYQLLITFSFTFSSVRVAFFKNVIYITYSVCLYNNNNNNNNNNNSSSSNNKIYSIRYILQFDAIIGNSFTGKLPYF